MNKTMVITVGWLLATASQAQTLGDALEQAWSRHPQAQVFNAREMEAQARAELAAGLLAEINAVGGEPGPQAGAGGAHAHGAKADDGDMIGSAHLVIPR